MSGLTALSTRYFLQVGEEYEIVFISLGLFEGGDVLELDYHFCGCNVLDFLPFGIVVEYRCRLFGFHAATPLNIFKYSNVISQPMILIKHIHQSIIT